MSLLRNTLGGKINMNIMFVIVLLNVYSNVNAQFLGFEHITELQCYHGASDNHIPKVSYHACLDECKSRDLCTGVSYRHVPPFCIVHEVDAIAGSGTGCESYIYSEKTSWTEATAPCESLRCDLSRSKCSMGEPCSYTDCEHPITANPNLRVYGNQRTQGFKLAVRCYGPLSLRSVTCLPNEDWNDVFPACTTAPPSTGSSGAATTTSSSGGSPGAATAPAPSGGSAGGGNEVEDDD